MSNKIKSSVSNRFSDSFPSSRDSSLDKPDKSSGGFCGLDGRDGSGGGERPGGELGGGGGETGAEALGREGFGADAGVSTRSTWPLLPR